MHTSNALIAVRKPLTCLVAAGALFATAAGIAAAEPPGSTISGGSGAGSTAPGTSHHTVITYSTDPYGYSYQYEYVDPAPQPVAPDPATTNRLSTGGSDHTWMPVARPDGTGWTVCTPYSTVCR
ncbi:hypothetical protein [Nocardia sp. NPDC004123]